LPPRICSSAVITIHGAGVVDAVAQALAEKPPNTTECVAPMRAHACMAATPSTPIGM
jgi:hypothetical protein